MKITFLYPVSHTLVIICVPQWNSKYICVEHQEHDGNYNLVILKLGFQTKLFFIALYITLLFHISCWTDGLVFLNINN